MLMLNQSITPKIYTPNPIIEKFPDYMEINKPYGKFNCGGTFLNQDDCFIYYFVKTKSVKEEILEMFNNEVYFDDVDEKAAQAEINRLIIEKKGNFYSYYD